MFHQIGFFDVVDLIELSPELFFGMSRSVVCKGNFVKSCPLKYFLESLERRI